MNVYVVVQQGVYRHDIPGVFDKVVDAVNAAATCAREDGQGNRVDGYHDWEIIEYRVNDGDGVIKYTVGWLNKGRYDTDKPWRETEPHRYWIPPSLLMAWEGERSNQRHPVVSLGGLGLAILFVEP
jgi:hypothetical protein